MAVLLVAATTTTTTTKWSGLLVDAQGVDLGGGIITQTDVQSYADLSQDVAEIQNYLSAGQVDEAMGVYREGLHSQSKPGVKRSLASLGDEMAKADPATPSFLYHVYGETQRSFNDALDGTKLNYVNNLVLQILEEQRQVAPSTSTDGISPAVEAIWAVNLYMYATHLLFTGVYNCQKHSMADNPSVFNVGTANWDEFIALYIGSGQTPGSSTGGNSLYAWAQKYADAFDIGDPEAPVNTKIKLLYQQAMNVMNVPQACTGGGGGDGQEMDTARSLWKLAVQVTSELSKPLFQGLLHALTGSKNAALVKLYSQALVPQMSKCRSSLYKRFYETLITNDDEFDVNDDGSVQAILDDLPEATSCFGYSCGDLAADTGMDACIFDFESYLSYAGYVPVSRVRAVGMADLDINQMKILIELQARDFATYLYMHGANIAKFGLNKEDPMQYVSLHDIATTSERENAEPWYDNFVSYHKDEFYADKVIRSALAGGDDSKWKSTDQVMAIVSTTASYQILLLEAVAKLKIAVAECQKSDQDDPPNFELDPIDEAAALTIGSMEGADLGGSLDLQDGQLIYNILNRHAFQFGTMEPDAKIARAVSEIEDYFYAARGQLDALACSALEVTTQEIVKQAMIGIVQGCIFLADKNAKVTPLSTSGDLAQMEGLAMSFIPLVATNNDLKPQAEILARNLIWTPGSQPVPDGAVVTGKALGQAFTLAMQLSCPNLGSIPTVNPCDGPWGSIEFKEASGATTIATEYAVLRTCVTVALSVLLFVFV
ncbi:hypothetical protein ACA910_018835 [Epithemia clementina (nom. ined.)]